MGEIRRGRRGEWKTVEIRTERKVREKERGR